MTTTEILERGRVAFDRSLCGDAFAQLSTPCSAPVTETDELLLEQAA